MEQLREALERAKTGDIHGFALLVELFQDMAVGYCYSIVRLDLENHRNAQLSPRLPPTRWAGGSWEFVRGLASPAPATLYKDLPAKSSQYGTLWPTRSLSEDSFLETKTATQ